MNSMYAAVKRLLALSIAVFSLILFSAGCRVRESSAPGSQTPADELEWDDPLIKYILSFCCLGSERMNELTTEYDEEYNCSIETEAEIYEFADIVYNYMDENGIHITSEYLEQIKSVYIGAWTPDCTHVEIHLDGEEHPRCLIFHYGTKVGSIKDFGKLPNLQWLEITEGAFSNLSPLSGIKTLEWLALDCSNVEDMSVIGMLPALKGLYIANASAPDMSAISGLGKLETLRFANCKELDVQRLAACLPASVKELSFDHCGIEDASALEALEQLETLSISEA